MSEWAKHIITLASAILVLGVTLLKDIVRPVGVLFTLVILLTLVVSFTLLLTSVWKALSLIRHAASSIISSGLALGGDDLNRLQELLTTTQTLFLLGLVSFAVLAVLSIASWSFVGPASPHGSVIIPGR